MDFLQLLLNGVALGAAYALVALGFVLVLNATGAVNFAQGDLVMAGGLLTVALAPLIPAGGTIPGLVLLPVVLVAMAGLGLLFSALAYFPLRRGPPVSIFISTIAIAIILQHGANALFGPEVRAGPPLLSGGAVEIGGLTLGRQGLASIVLAAILITGLFALLFRTQLGRRLRATAQDPEMARAVGVPVSLMIALSFALGTALAGAAGLLHREEPVATGLLGANLVIDRDRYRISRVYTGESWNPFIKAPLATPGNEASEGEYILAINGTPLTAQDNIHKRLQGTVGKQTTLRVGPRPNGREARDIIIEPVRSESTIRLWAWIEKNRHAVDEATDGRVGYVYLPNTAGAGYTFFNRMFFPQVDKEALIIDERGNGGGQAANYIIEVLSRDHLAGWLDRDGAFYNTPAGAIHGPKVMLIDQDAGSGGDFLPWAFRQVGIGKLIGTRTWGGLIGVSFNPRLMDGGNLSVPFFRFFDPSSNWSVENEGVTPDIEVDLDPIATNAGRDTQLERAIAEVMAQLAEFEPSVPQEAPALPTRLGD